VIRQPLICLLGLLLLAGGCANKDQQSTGGFGELPSGSFKADWTARLELGARERVKEIHLRGDSVFVYTTANNSYMLSRSGGHVQAIHRVGGQSNIEAPVILQDRILYPTNTGLAQFDLKGKRLEPIELGVSLRGGADGTGKLVYVGTDHPNGGRLVCIDLDRVYSPAKWELLTIAGVSSTPTVYQSIVYFASEDGLVYAVNENRAAVWGLPGGVYRTGGKITADVVADDFGVYIASFDTKLVALHRSTGKLRWQYFAGVPLATTPAVTRDRVYQFVPGKGIICINKLEGEYTREPVWTVSATTQLLGEDDSAAYLRTRDNHVIAIDRKTGQPKFRSESRFDAFATNTRDGKIFVATRDGTIQALSAVKTPGEVGHRAALDTPAELALSR
jgi:outer membrane protein assembly factor BamB